MSTTPPEVTVLMGVFNAGRHLDEAISSIRAQSFADFEFLIVDDASTDGSRDIIRAHAEQDRRVRVLTNVENSGLGQVLSRGVQEARGALIARMDADDVAVPVRLEKQVQFMRSHPETDVLGSYALDVDEDGRPVRERRVPTTHDRIVKLMWSNPLIHPTVMFRRDRILSAGSYSPVVRRRQDYELWFRCVQSGLRFANLAEPLVRYRMTPATLKRNDMRAMWHQVKMGLQGCRIIRASPLAYVAVSLPLLEAALPGFLRMRLLALKKRIDPRHHE